MPQLPPQLTAGVAATLLALTALLILIDALAQWRGRPLGKMFAAGLAGTLVLALLSHAVFLLGVGGAGIFLLFGFGIPYLAEGLGLRFGMAGSRYEYIGWVGPLLPLGVPLYVMIAWVGLLYGVANFPTLLIAYHTHWVGADGCSLFSIILVSTVVGLLMAVIDMIIDPIAVREGRWMWKQKGAWYGIPIGNFIGWILVAVITLIPIYASQVAALPDSLQTYYPKGLPEYTSPYLIFAPTAILGLLFLHLAGRAKGAGLSRLAWMSRIEGILTLLLYALVVYYFELVNHSFYRTIERGL